MSNRGRPTIFTQELADRICYLMKEEGLTLRKVCARPEMPSKTAVLEWADKYPSFAVQYARAREGLADYWADDITEITDNESRDLQPDGKGGMKSDNTAVNRDKLKAESRLKLMALFAPKKYGVKVQNELSGPNGGPIQLQGVDSPPQETREQWIERTQRERLQQIEVKVIKE